MAKKFMLLVLGLLYMNLTISMDIKEKVTGNKYGYDAEFKVLKECYGFMNELKEEK